jgi:hypothetical protein
LPEEGIALWFARTFWATTAHAGVLDEVVVEVVRGVRVEPLQAGAAAGRVLDSHRLWPGRDKTS